VLTEIEVLHDVTRRLDSLALPYMLTGSLALGYYAQPRMTRDIDIVLALSDVDVSRLVAALSDEYYVPEALARSAVSRGAVFNVIHSKSIVKVDFIVRKDSPYRHHEFDRRREVEIGGAKVSIVSKEDLVLSKLDWARPSRSELQLRDVASLLASGCDLEYLHRWARDLEVDGLLAEVLG
jgi:hypothetical protein